jgi:transcriptional regulator with XRE-family HTH domain
MIDIRRIRQERGLTMKQLGEMTDLSESYISMIETMERTPSVSAAKRIAQVLGFDWTRFFDK